MYLPKWRPQWTPAAIEAELEMPPLLPVPGALHPAAPNVPLALLLLLAALATGPMPFPLPRPGPVVPLVVGFFQPRQLLHNDSASELQLQSESSSKRMESSKLNRSISSGFHSLPPPPLAAFASAPAPPAAAPPAAAALLLLLLRPAATAAAPAPAAPPAAASALLLLLLPLRFARLKLSFKRSASL